jgi:hypothetical protein
MHPNPPPNKPQPADRPNQSTQVCVTFPEKPGMTVEEHSEEQQATLKQFCGHREPAFYNEELQNRKVIHFGSGHVRAVPRAAGRVVVVTHLNLNFPRM